MPDSAVKKPMKPPFPVKSVPLKALDLDVRNSRFPRDAQSQDDALELMVTTAGDDCLQLLRDLTHSGEMNSSDLPIVVQKGNRYVVMEGNRRLTCLRIWHDVEVLAAVDGLEADYRARAERLIGNSAYAVPNQLRVVIAPTEEAADTWIERKHASGAGGAGTVEWGAAMKDRRKARNNPAAASRAMAFIELVSSELEEEHDIQTDLEIVRSKRYTMIQRFVDRGIVRNRLGLEFEAGKMHFAYGPEATKAIVRVVMHDFAQPKADSGKTWARELDTVDDFTKYLDQYAALLPTTPSQAGNATPTPAAPRPALGGGTRSDSVHAGGRPATPGTDSTPAPGDATPDPRPPRPTPPPSYIFRGLVLDQFTNRIQEIVRQTSLLPLQRNSEVVSVLLRVILELSTYQFLKSHGMDVERHLDRSLRSAIKRIEPNASDDLGQAESTSPLCKAFHETTANNIRLVQYAVHDMHSGRTPSEILTLANRYEPVLVAMNANMGNNPLT